jgi:hypothetical protein
MNLNILSQQTPGPSICKHTNLIVEELATFAFVTAVQQTTDTSQSLML